SLVDGKSIMAVMMLAAGQGTSLHLRTEGDQEQEALDALVALINDRFGEGEEPASLIAPRPSSSRSAPSRFGWCRAFPGHCLWPLSAGTCPAGCRRWSLPAPGTGSRRFPPSSRRRPGNSRR